MTTVAMPLGSAPPDRDGGVGLQLQDILAVAEHNPLASPVEVRSLGGTTLPRAGSLEMAACSMA